MQKNNYSRLEMQIPQENTYIGFENASDIDFELEELSKNYRVNNLQQVKDFIKKHDGLLPYINKITPIINNHFPDHLKCLTFCKDPEFEKLNDITIYIKGVEATFEEDCEKINELEIELIKINDFSRSVKKLISVDLWL